MKFRSGVSTMPAAAEGLTAIYASAALAAGLAFAPLTALAQSDGVRSFHVQGNVHMIVGAGANIAVQVGDDGIIVVDTGNGEMSDGVLREIRALSDYFLKIQQRALEFVR